MHRGQTRQTFPVRDACLKATSKELGTGAQSRHDDLNVGVSHGRRGSPPPTRECNENAYKQ